MTSARFCFKSDHDLRVAKALGCFWTYSRREVQKMPRIDAAQASRVHWELFLNLPWYLRQAIPSGFLWAHFQLTWELTRRANGILYFLLFPDHLPTDLFVIFL